MKIDFERKPSMILGRDVVISDRPGPRGVVLAQGRAVIMGDHSLGVRNEEKTLFVNVKGKYLKIVA